MRTTNRLLLACVISALCLGLSARIAESETYSFDYVVASSGGAGQESAAYSMIALIRTKGAESREATSANYEIKTVLDAAGSGTSAVADWSLY